ncbi:MAG TPA: hypothetical protein VI653_16315 [Steroidobacteraceae bacterium]
MLRKLTLFCLAVALMQSTAAMAFDLDPSIFSFNGFGSVSEVHTNLHKADYTAGLLQPNGAGYSRRWSNDVDAILGLQMTAKPTEQLTAVVQLVSQQRYDNKYGPGFEWANLQYAFTPDVKVRVGRFAMPTFLFSDTRLVHYAMMAVRPSVEVYRVLPVTNADGVDASYHFKIGDVSNTVEAIYAQNFTQFATSLLKNRGVTGIFDNLEWKNLLVHTAYQIRQIHSGPTTSVSYKLADIGINYDNGKWFLMTEGARTWARPVFSAPSRTYVANTGYRIGPVAPYVQFSKLEPVTKFSVAGTRTVAQHAGSLGVRWDFMSNFALKAQWDHLKTDNSSTGTLVNVQPGFIRNRTAEVVSFALDCVF